MNWNAGSWTINTWLKEDPETYDSQRLPQVPDTPTAWGGASALIFKEPGVSKEAVVSSTPHIKLCHLIMNISDVSSFETSKKETGIEVETPARYAQLNWKSSGKGVRSKTVHPLGRAKQETPTVAHNLQLATKEFQKIKELENIKIERELFHKCDASF